MASSLLQTDVAVHSVLAIRPLLPKLEAWAEAERERIGLWVPVALALGITAWFALPSPSCWLGWIMLCCGAAIGMYILPMGERLRAMLLCAGLLLAAGCALIWAKSLLAGQPPLQRSVYAAFTAEVIGVEPQPALAPDAGPCLAWPERFAGEGTA